MYIFQIFKLVHDKYRGVPVRLSEKSGLSDEWYRSFGYKPKTLDPFGNGNKCPQVEDFISFCEEYESGAKGAGLMLLTLVYHEIKCRLHPEIENCTMRELRHSLLSEGTDVVRALDEKELADASPDDLKRYQTEISELIAAAELAASVVNREIENREVREIFTGSV